MQCACLLSRFLLQQGLVLEHKPIHRHFNAWPMLTMAACICFIRIIDCTLAVQVCGSLEAASRQIVYPHYQWCATVITVSRQSYSYFGRLYRSEFNHRCCDVGNEWVFYSSACSGTIKTVAVNSAWKVLKLTYTCCASLKCWSQHF